MKKTSMLLAAALLAVVLATGVHASARQLTALSPDGISLSYTVQGKGEPALVFVHCWSCDKSYWKNQVSYFEKKYKVVTIDLAGHGESGLGRKDWTVESFGGDVVAVVKALDLKRVILVGHSMGGDVILEAARRIPGKVLGLVGVDTYQNFAQKVPEDQRAGLAAALTANFSGVTNQFVRSMFPTNADSTLVASVASDMASAPPEVGIGAMKNLLGYDPAPALKELRIPIRSINADKWPTDVEGNKKLAHSYDVKFMPGRGHFVQLEDPATFNRLLEETIREILKAK